MITRQLPMLLARSWPSKLVQMDLEDLVCRCRRRVGRWPAVHGRQIVFRTTERFWEPGKHVWQLNANSSATNTNNTIWGDTIFLSVGFRRQLACYRLRTPRFRLSERRLNPCAGLLACYDCAT